MNNLTYKSVDVMKKSKDTLTNQLTTAEKQSLVSTLATLGVTHIAISVPLDDNSVFIANGTNPSPRTAEAEVQDWCDVIHAQMSIYGKPLNVMHRGTFSGVENIWNVPYDTGTAIGSASSAASDGNTTWCGRWYRYLNNHVGSHVLTGDIFAPVPEGATLIVQGSGNAWLNQSNYNALFLQLHTIMNTYGTTQSVSVTFMSHNNFSDVASGWLFGSLTADQHIVGADYYGQRQGSTKVQPADYVYDWQQLYLGKDSNGGSNTNNSANLSQFWSEWGDLPSAVPAGAENNSTTWAAFLNAFYSAIRDNLVPPHGHLIGFNYWGGWEGQNTSILNKTGSGASAVYSLNFRGQILQSYFTPPTPPSPPPLWNNSNKVKANYGELSKSVNPVFLWSAGIFPWQLALPWQYVSGGPITWNNQTKL